MTLGRSITLHSLLLCYLALTPSASAQGPPPTDCNPSALSDWHRACPESWGDQCPNPASGRVVADRAFDWNSDAVLTYCEIQCAIDCLDGDTAQEHALRAVWTAPPQFDELPEAIPGGELILDASITYMTNRPLELPLRANGAVVIRGNGARISLTSPNPAICCSRDYALFERLPPFSSNTCDLNAMREGCAGWSIENLDLLLLIPESQRPTVKVKAIMIDGAERLSIRSCKIAGSVFTPNPGGSFDSGVELRFCRSCLVEMSKFTNVRRQEVLLGDVATCGPSGLDPCWSDNTLPPSVFPAPVTCMSDTGSNSSILRKNEHYSYPAGPSPGNHAVRIHGSTGVILEAESFEGSRPSQFITWTGARSGILEIRSPRFELGTDCSLAEGLIRVEPPGTMIIDSVETTISCDQLLLDASTQQQSGTFVVRNSRLAANLRLAASADPPTRAAQLFMFQDLQMSFSQPAQWLSPVPDHIIELSADRMLFPTVPLDPTDIAVRQIWMDPEGRLKFCCDASGRVLKALTVDQLGNPGP